MTMYVWGRGDEGWNPLSVAKRQIRKVYDDKTCSIVKWEWRPKMNIVDWPTEWSSGDKRPRFRKRLFKFLFLGYASFPGVPFYCSSCEGGRLDACNTVIPRCLFKWSILFDKLRWSACFVVFAFERMVVSLYIYYYSTYIRSTVVNGRQRKHCQNVVRRNDGAKRVRRDFNVRSVGTSI